MNTAVKRKTHWNTPKQRGKYFPFSFSCPISYVFRFIFKDVDCDLKVHTWYQIELMFQECIIVDWSNLQIGICYLQELRSPYYLWLRSTFASTNHVWQSIVIPPSAKLVMHLAYWQLDIKGYCIKMNVHQGSSKFK